MHNPPRNVYVVEDVLIPRPSGSSDIGSQLWNGFLLQMRWYPPSEATQQGWKSRQFC